MKKYGRTDEINISKKIRENFFTKHRLNQYWLFKNNFEWMHPYIKSSDTVLELGCSHGLSKEFIKNKNLVLSDVDKFPLSDKVIDAHNIQLPDNSFNVVFCQHILHHLSYPIKALREVSRILKPGGYFLIQEVKGSLLFKF